MKRFNTNWHKCAEWTMLWRRLLQKHSTKWKLSFVECICVDEWVQLCVWPNFKIFTHHHTNKWKIYIFFKMTNTEVILLNHKHTHSLTLSLSQYVSLLCSFSRECYVSLKIINVEFIYVTRISPYSVCVCLCMIWLDIHL